MTEPRQLAVVREYGELIDALRARAEELNISRETLDAITGLQAGYCSKLLAPVPIRNLGPVSLGPVIQALGLAIRIIEDPEAEARFSAQRAERARESLSVGKHEISTIQITHRKLRILARRGGKKRAQKLTPFRRRQIAKMGAKAKHRKMLAAKVAIRRRARLAAMRARDLTTQSSPGAPVATPSPVALPAPCATRSPLPNG